MKQRPTKLDWKTLYMYNRRLPWWMLYLDDDRILEDIQLDLYARVLGITPEEMALSDELCAYFRAAGDEIQSGNRTSIPVQEWQDRVNEIAERHGCEFGIPLPAVSPLRDRDRNYLVMADGVPLAGILEANQSVARAMRNEAEGSIFDRYKLKTVNSWRIYKHEYACVVAGPNGERAYWPERMEGCKMRKLLETMGVRMDSALSAEAEERAQKSLKAKINDSQWRSYMLNDLFLERSPRSDLHYVFRKGYPTLVLTFHGAAKEGRCIAALCLHPMGFFQYTHAGLMTPTDEVICHLLLMRADEHRLWKKSGQWHVLDSRSGL